MKFEQRLVKFSEAKALIEKQAAQVKAGTKELAEPLKKNLDLVKMYKGINENGVIADDTVIPIEVEEVKDPADVQAGIMTGVEALTKKVDELLGLAKGDGVQTELVEKETALEIAVEVINGFVAKLTTLKEKISAGESVTEEDMKNILGWQVIDAVEAAVQTASVAQAQQSAVEKAELIVKDALSKHLPDDSASDGDTPSEGDPPKEGDQPETPPEGDPAPEGDTPPEGDAPASEGDPVPDAEPTPEGDPPASEGDTEPGGEPESEGDPIPNASEKGDGEDDDDLDPNVDLSPPLPAQGEDHEFDDIDIEGV